MKKRLGLTGYWAAALILGAILILVVSDLTTSIGGCTYDDLPNVWSCTGEWATEIVYDLEVIILLVAYPALFIGIVLAVVRMIRGK